MMRARLFTHGLLVLSAVVLLGSAAAAADATAFQSAKPIWPKGRETEMNLLVGFRAEFERPAAPAVLQVAAATIYRAYLNGEFLGCGPARGPHGFYRIDEWKLADKLQPGKNVLAIEVAGYNSNSYYLLDEPSFLQAEIVAGDQVLASTAGAGQPFVAQLLPCRVQKVARYSFQRPFSEVYRLTPDWAAWRTAASPAAAAVVETAVMPTKNLLPRHVLYPDYTLYTPIKAVSAGQVKLLDKPPQPTKDRSLTNTGPKLKGFPEKELATIPCVEIQRYASQRTATLDQPYAAAQKIALKTHDYQILDLGVNRTGFLGATVSCKTKTRFWLLFDEILSNDDVNQKRLGCVNIISYELEPGTYKVEALEPYTLRYLKVLCMDGACDVSNIYMREYAHPAVKATFTASDERLNRIFAAAVETFRQNSLDIFMDCPSRERAGWLCDSFFTARAAGDLAGEPRVEQNFVENFCLPERFACLPEGMLPMCYPADHYDGVFIPNWALWFVVQLEEYNARGGNPALVEALRPKVLKLFNFFKKYENQDGLLEKLPSWVFVEWSAANRFVQDVNYPSNMLYAGALDAAARVYHLPDLAAKAKQIRQTVLKQSFDGQFFVDNATRDKAGKLNITKNRTEVCQYFAFFFNVATPETHPELWAALRDKFGPNRKQTKAFPEIHPANSFIGNMLRMELLSAEGRSQQILDESVAYLLYMVERTGTLWENDTPVASCDHGFASHAAHTLYRDVLGVSNIDRAKKEVTIQFGDAVLEHCVGTIPVDGGAVSLRWQRKGDVIEYHLDLPAGYHAAIENRSGKKLVAQ